VQEGKALRVATGILLDTYGLNGIAGVVDDSTSEAFGELILSSVGLPVASCQLQN
jgi:hypothetical protein